MSGSGGVMLPNHAPLVIAERFKIPGRCFQGGSRSARTCAGHRSRLRPMHCASACRSGASDDFLERPARTDAVGDPGIPANHPYNGSVVAMPDDTPLPPILAAGIERRRRAASRRRSASDSRSRIASPPHDAVAALTHYRSHFQPSRWRRAAWHPYDRGCCRRDRRRGRAARASIGRSQPTADRGQHCRCRARGGAGLSYTEAERALVAHRVAAAFVGSPATVMQRIQPLIFGK